MSSFHAPTWSRPYWREGTCCMCTSAAENRCNLLLFLPLLSLEAAACNWVTAKHLMWKHSSEHSVDSAHKSVHDKSLLTVGPCTHLPLSTYTSSFVRNLSVQQNTSVSYTARLPSTNPYCCCPTPIASSCLFGELCMFCLPYVREDSLVQK